MKERVSSVSKERILLSIFLLDRIDRSGIRFLLGNTLRQHDLAYLTFGTTPNEFSLAIPPNIEHFNVDSYCPMEASMVSTIVFAIRI